jgi:hypothetical protein
MLIRTLNHTTKLFFIIVVSSCFLQPTDGISAGQLERGIRAAMSGPAVNAPEEAAVPLSLVRAHYFLEVIGSTATGTLEQEFRNDTSIARRAAYSMTGMAGLRTVDLHYEIDGEQTPALEDAKTSSAAEAGHLRTQRASASAGASVMRGRAIEVGAEQTVVVRTDFRLEVPLVQGRSRLQLPIVLTEASPVESPYPQRSGGDPRDAGEAGLRQRLETVPLSITINVHHDRSLTEVDSPSHELMVNFEGDRTVIEPARMGSRSREAFDLVYSLGGLCGAGHR